MGDFILYLLKSSFYLILFYFFFKVVMSRTTFFRLNRYLIIIGLTLCLVLPFIRITVPETNTVFSNFHQFEELFTLYPEQVGKQVDVTDNLIPLNPGNDLSVQPTTEKRFLLVPTLLVVYLTGVFISTIIFLTSYFRMMRLINRLPHKAYGNHILVLAGNDICSFSWGRYIVIAEKDYLHNPEILLHETVHIDARHTWDLLYIQLFQIFQWFNPALWLLKRELQEIHEYQADNETINKGIDATKYQLLLVQKAVGTRLYSMANGFNHSKLKNRISMMLKERTSKYVAWRVLLLLPLMSVAMYLFAQQQNTPPETAKVTGETDFPLSLESYFRDEFVSYQQIAPKYSYGTRDKDSRSNYLFINIPGQIMLNSDFAELENLSEDIIRTVNEKRRKSLKKGGKAETQVLNIIWDRGSGHERVNDILDAVYKASVKLKEDDIKPDTKQVYPMVVNFPEEVDYRKPWNKPEPTDENEIIQGIEISIHVAGKKVAELKNFSRAELRSKLNDIISTDDVGPIAIGLKTNDVGSMAIGLKVDPTTKMGIVTDIKTILREVYATKPEINMQLWYQRATNYN